MLVTDNTNNLELLVLLNEPFLNETYFRCLGQACRAGARAGVGSRGSDSFYRSRSRSRSR